MDPQSGLLSRAGTSVWTLFQGVANYITSAVGRYLWPEPPNTGNDDINIIPEATVCKQRERSLEEEEKSLNENNKEKERENKGDDAENSGKKLADPCQITLATDSKTTQCSIEYDKSVVTEKGDKERERSRKDHDQVKIIPVTAKLSNEDAEEKGITQEEIQQGDTHMRHGCLIEPRKGERGKQDNHQTEDDIQKYEWQKQQKVDIKQDDAKSREDDFKGERRFFEIKVKTVGIDYRTMEGGEGILGIKERQSEMRKGEEPIGMNQSYKESQAEQEGNGQSGGLEETGTTSRERQVSCQGYEKNKVNIQTLEREFTANVFEQEREKHRLEDKGEMEEIRGELETLNQNQESVSVEEGDESCAVEKSGEDGKRETYSFVLERRKEIEYRPHRAQTQSADENDESDTNQEEKRKTDGEQIETGDVETEGGPQEVNIETNYKMTVVEIEDGKDEENEKETKSDEEEATDLGNGEIQMGRNFEEPQDKIKQEECEWKEEVEKTRGSGHRSVTENEKHKEMKHLEREITVSIAELEKERERIEEEEDVQEITEDLEAADKPQEFVTTEEKEELCTLEKGSRVGEMEVCSSEFERGEEWDNYVEKEDVEIHFEDRWPVQARTEEHLTLGFDFQELEKTHKETETIPEDKVVAIQQTQWSDDSKGEQSAQKERQTETEYRCDRAHAHSGEEDEDEESDTNQEEEKKRDAEQIEAGEVETEGVPQEVSMEIKYKMTEAETKYGKDEENEEETRSDDVETRDLGKREIALETSFKKPEDEMKEVESGRVEENKYTKEKDQVSVTENEKHKEMKHLETEITVSIEELEKERERIEEEEDVQELIEDLEAADKPQEFVTTEEKEELCTLEKGRRVGEMEVCSSEFERGEERDNYVEKEDVEIHFEDRWPVQARTEEHLTLGFDFQELEKTNKEAEMIPEDKVVAISQTQWSEDIKDEQSAQQERQTETEHRCDRAHAHSGEEDEDEESDTNQEEEKKRDAEQIEAGKVETEGVPQEVSMEIKYKMTEAETKYGKDEENEEETRSDDVETRDLGKREIALETSFKKPEDEMKEVESGRVEENKSAKEKDQVSVTENEKHKEMKHLETEITVSIAELEKERERIEEEEDVQELIEDLEAADKPQEFVTTEEKEELCTLEKGRRVGEMEVCSSEFERGEERDNYVEKEDVEIHFEDRWPVQARTEEHLTLGFDFQELEKTNKEAEMIPEDKVVAISQTQWSEDIKDEQSAQQERQTETEHRCDRAHAHSGEEDEDEESDTNQEEEKKRDAEQIEAGKVETEGVPQEVSMEIKYKMTEAETKYGKDEENEEETRSDDVETRDLGKKEIALETSFKKPEDEMKEVESGRVEENKSAKEKDQVSVTENEKHKEMKHLETEITVSIAELEKERERIEEEEDVQELIEDLEAADKPQEFVTTEEKEELCTLEKGRRVGEMEVCSSEFERGEERDNYVEKEDVEIHFEDRWPVQARTEEHLTLGFDFQELEKTNKEAETIPEDKVVAISQTQWSEDIKDEQSAQKERQTETEHRCDRAHAHSGEEDEDEESDTNQEEEKKRDAEQIEAGEVETEGGPQEVNIETNYKMTVVEIEDGKDEENEKETKSDEEEATDLGNGEIQMGKNFEEPQDEIKQEECGWKEEVETTRGSGHGSVTENEKHKEMKHLEREITVSIAELGKERERIEEKQDVEEITEDLEVRHKHQESATEEGAESCLVEKGSKDGEWDVYSPDVEKREEKDANIEKGDTEVHFEDQWSLQIGTKEHLRLGFDFQESETTNKETVETITKEEDVEVSGTQWRDYMKHEENVYKQTENNQEEERKMDEEQIHTEEMKMGEPQEINIKMKYKVVTVEREDGNDENDMETPELGEDEIEMNKSCKESQHEIKGEEEFRRSMDTESTFGDELGKVLENERNDGLQELEGEITVNTLKLEKVKQSKEKKEEMNELIEHLETEDKSQEPVMMEVGEESLAFKKGWEDGEREVCSTVLKEEEKDIKAKKQYIKVQFEDRWTAQSEGYLPSLVSSQKFATAHKTDQAIAVDKPVAISVTQWRDDMQPNESIYKGTETDDGKSQRTKGKTGEKDGSHTVSIEWDVKITEEDAVHEETNEAVSQQSKTAEELSFSGVVENEEDKELCRKEDIFNGIELKNDSKVKCVNSVEMKDEIIEVNQEAITRSIDEPEERNVGETDIDDVAEIRDEFHIKDTAGKNVEETECRKDESRTEHMWEMQTEEREEQVAPAYVASMGQKEKRGENTMDEKVTERGAEVFVEGEGMEVLKWQSMSSKNKVVGEDTEGSEVLVDEKEELQVRKDPEGQIIERNVTNELAERQTKHKGYVRQESKGRMTMEDSGKNLIMVLDVNAELVEDYKDKSAHNELGAVTLRSGMAENKSEEERKSDYNGEMRAQVCKTDEKQEVTEARDWVEDEETAKEKTDNSEVYRQETERTKIQGEDTKQEQNKSNEKESYGQNGKTEMLVTETLEEEEKGEQPISMGGTKREVGEEIRANVRNEDIPQDDVQKREDEQRVYEGESKKFVLQVDAPSLDFTAQKSRIALKNRQVRAPKDPRILLQKASVIPIHSARPQGEGFNTKPLMMKVGGGGVMGIKLPGFGGGIPALKKRERGVREKSEEVTGQISEKELTANAGIDVREQSSSKQREAGTKMGGVGAIGVKLPAFGTGLPVLRKTDRGVKMREEIADDDERPHGEYGTARAEGKGAESKEKEVKSTGAPAVKLPSFGAGFPLLRKTERGMKMKSGEDLEKSEADKNLNDTDKPDGGSQSEKADVGNPLLSELKFKLKKTDRK